MPYCWRAFFLPRDAFLTECHYINLIYNSYREITQLVLSGLFYNSNWYYTFDAESGIVTTFFSFLLPNFHPFNNNPNNDGRTDQGADSV